MPSLERKGLLKTLHRECGLAVVLTDQEIDELWGQSKAFVSLRMAASTIYLQDDAKIRDPKTTRDEALYLAGRQDALEFLMNSRVFVKLARDQKLQQVEKIPDLTHHIDASVKNARLCLDKDDAEIEKEEHNLCRVDPVPQPPQSPPRPPRPRR